MKSNELRLGNWIGSHKDIDWDGAHVRTGNIKVESISRDEDPVLYVRTFKDFRIAITLSECEPIPLTKEWLLKFGFEKDDVKFYWDILEYQTSYKIEEGFLGVLSPDGSTNGHTVFIPCQYVHQLQNAYFALTGEELTFQS